MKDLLEELEWRGLLADSIPGTREQLLKENTPGYVGFDPTSDSLGIGNFVPVMLLAHYQRAGHQPFALLGGATGLVGDPSGKSQERNLQTPEQVEYNLSCIKKQLEKFIDFNDSPTGAKIVNNYDWFKEFSFLDFIRDVGKHISINYMMSKDSVKKRLETGISFTEFSYQLIQGYDFLHLYQNYGVKLQFGGSDQWGNLTTGTELIRRKSGGEVFAFTAPLITKSDGTKFGKSERGNIFLSAEKTSPYHFYQFWLNVSDEDAAKYIKIFTFKTREEIEALIEQHKQAPHLRILQKTLAEDITVRVHSTVDYEKALEASEILFGKATKDTLMNIDSKTLLEVFDGVPSFNVSKDEVTGGIIDFLASTTQVFASKGEARRMLTANAVSVNKEKVKEDFRIGAENLINGKYIVVQKGKKDYFLVIAE
jgi:tyrosyl-tRNA synthetase